METKPLSPEKIAQIREVLKSMDIDSASPSLIQDNKIIFPYQNKVYRIHMPNQREQSEAENAQNQFKIKLIKEGEIITKKSLIKILKEKQDIDIAELEKKREKISKEYQDIYLDLAVVDSIEIEKIEELRSKKNEVEKRLMEVVIEISEMLTPCLEEQTKIEYHRHLAYSCTEKQIDNDNFEAVWENYEQFRSDGTGLTLLAIEYVYSLLLSVRE
jgi:hypothetical protein